jgi:hypothetical protein
VRTGFRIQIALKYLRFALPDYQNDTNHILLCRTLAFSDIAVELLNYHEDVLRRSIPVQEFSAELTGSRRYVDITTLTASAVVAVASIDRVAFLLLGGSEPMRYDLRRFTDVSFCAGPFVQADTSNIETY